MRMPTLEQVVLKLCEEPDWWKKILIGGVLTFFPIVHFVALGYLMEIAQNIIRKRSYELPEWNEWPSFIIKGVYLNVIAVACFLPFFLCGWFVSLLLGELSFRIFVFGGLYLFPMALYLFLKTGDWKSLCIWKAYENLFKLVQWRFLLPIVVLAGVTVLGLPFYGLSIFLGLAIYITYTLTVFIVIQSK